MKDKISEMDFLVNALIGLSKEKAEELCAFNGYSSCILLETSMVIYDFRFDRVSLHIENNLVTKAIIG